MKSSVRYGMTLIEMLVVIAIIGILVALLIPAVQAARQAAQKAECANQLHQTAVAVQLHQDTWKFIPSNGWGYKWVGHPDRGSGPQQPGGWIYSILPYVEMNNLRLVGQAMPEPEQRIALGELIQTPVPMFKCPSRGPVTLFENDLDSTNTWPINAELTEFVARTDYAINEGDTHIKTNAGPLSLADELTFPKWPDTSLANGVSYVRSQVAFTEVLDGLSNTYFVGEKYVFAEWYLTILDSGYDQSMFTGADLDTNRATEDLPSWDGVDWRNKLPNNGARIFGSAHLGAMNMAFGDGHVANVNYIIDAQTHRYLGNRHDGQSVTLKN